MKESDDLFQLIHSLTKNEKGYFKKYSAMHTIGKQNKYLLLFDAIAKQNEYNESALRKKFKHERFTNQLHVAKNYLQQMILHSMEQYHDNVDAQLRSYLNQIEFLFNKSLFDQCFKLLEKTKAIANKYQRHIYKIELLSYEMELIRARAYMGVTEEEMEDVYKEEFKTIDQYIDVRKYSRLTSRIFLKKSKLSYMTRSASEKNIYAKVINDPLFDSEKNPRSFQAAFYFHLSHMGYYYSFNNYTDAYYHANKMVKLGEEHPHLVAANPKLQVNILSHLISCEFNLKKYGPAKENLLKLNAIKLNSKPARYNSFYFSYNIYLGICLNTGQFEKGVKLIKEIEKRVEAEGFQDLLQSNITIFNFYFANIYFGIGDLKNSLLYLNKMHSDENDMRQDMLYYAKIMQLIVHYEMENTDLLEYIVRSTYRYLYKRNRIFKFEDALLKFIRKKLPKVNSKKELIIAFKQLRVELLKIFKDPFEKKALEYFDFISWLDSKIESRSFAEIVREKASRVVIK